MKTITVKLVKMTAVKCYVDVEVPDDFTGRDVAEGPLSSAFERTDTRQLDWEPDDNIQDNMLMQLMSDDTANYPMYTYIGEHLEKITML
jgi:hypothetical protein